MRLLIGALVLLLGGVAYAGAPVSFSFPRINPIGSTVVVRVDVERHPDNRRLFLVWDGPISGSSSVELQGENAPTRHIFDKALRSLREGTYLVEAVVVRITEGKRVEKSTGAIELYVGTAPAEVF